jgi:hypothetical protein
MKVIAVRADMSRGEDDSARCADDGGLARAVRPNERKDFAMIHVEGNIMQDLVPLIRDGEVLDF